MFKQQIICLSETDSTNNDVLRHIGTAPEGSVWSARFQSAGRGQKGNRWESAKDLNLCFSILLRPEFLNVEDQFLISESVALGVADYLHNLGLESKIKWPNDIYVFGSKKIAGILIEHHIQAQKIKASIVGIGLNVNQTSFASDAPNPISLKTALSFADDKDPQSLLPDLLDCIEERYLSLNTNGRAALEADYHSLLFRLNEWASFKNLKEKAPKIIEGRILGVDRLGCLVLENRDSSRSSYAFKEISYII